MKQRYNLNLKIVRKEYNVFINFDIFKLIIKEIIVNKKLIDTIDKR